MQSAHSKSSVLRELSSFLDSFLADVSSIVGISVKGRLSLPELTPDFHAIFHAISVFDKNEDVTTN